MFHLISSTNRLRAAVSAAGGISWAFVGPVIPYGSLCTALIVADFVTARLLARRVRRKHPQSAVSGATHFSSHRFGNVIVTLAKAYALLLLAHGADCVLLGADSALSLLRCSAGAVCFWQFWSILENEASCNSALWATLAQRILIDKTNRHLGIDLSELQQKNK